MHKYSDGLPPKKMDSALQVGVQKFKDDVTKLRARWRSIIAKVTVPENRPQDVWELAGCPFPEYEEEILSIEATFRSKQPVPQLPDVEEMPRSRSAKRSPRNKSESSSSSSNSSNSSYDSRDSRSRKRRTFFGRLVSWFYRSVRVCFQLSCILLLLLTISSIMLAVSSVMMNTAQELLVYVNQAVEVWDYKLMTLGLVGCVVYALVLFLTLLACVMLVPALWVSVFDIVGFPWSLPFLDSFLP